MAFKLSVPSKTFILGEYVALVGGPTLVAATDKRFELIVSFTGHTKLNGVHGESPAGKYYAHHFEGYEGLEVSFIDPYNGLGGLGASSAQFVLLSALRNLTRNDFRNAQAELNPHKIWMDYRNLFATTDNWLPSGADVVSQLVGGITQFQWKPFKVEKHSWNLEGLSFLIFKTPKKVATHEHLNQLQNLDVEKLDHIAATATFALKEQDAFQFVKGLTQYHEALLEKDFVCDESIELIESLKRTDQLLSVKGCGALGADTLFVVCENQNIDNLKSLANVVGLKYVASNKSLSAGLRFDYTYDFKKQNTLSRTLSNELRL